jgi:amino acid transporter
MVQDLFTVAKVFALVIIILAGIVWLAFGHTQQLEEPLKNTDWSPGNDCNYLGFSSHKECLLKYEVKFLFYSNTEAWH